MVTPNLRRGVFPGSFNPLTVAHLEVARRAKEEHDLDEVHLTISRVALDKPAPPGPHFEERIAIIEDDAAEFEWLTVGTTDQQLIVDIADGYDLVIMGADKWEQVNDASYYGSTAERDSALARLPQVVVAVRTGSSVPVELLLKTDKKFHGISSTQARAGDRDSMAPRASARWNES